MSSLKKKIQAALEMAAFTPCNTEDYHATTVPHHGFEGQRPRPLSGATKTHGNGCWVVHRGRTREGLPAWASPGMAPVVL